MKTFAKVTQPDFKQAARASGKPQLITIPYSHFCDLSRWSLDAAGVDYEHRGYMPGAHILPVVNLRVGGEEKIVPTTSVVTNVKVKDDGGKRKDNGGATAVPLCVMPDGATVLPDSWSIATQLGKFEPPPEDLQRVIDEELGPLSRQVAYSVLLKQSNRNVWNDLCSNGGKSWFWYFAGRKVTEIMEEVFQPHDEAEVAKAKEGLRAVFSKLAGEAEKREAKLSAGGKPDLTDLAMAALAAPAVMPPEYCRGEYLDQFSRLEQQDEAARQEAHDLRTTPLGKFAMMMYAKHRAPVPRAAL